MYQRPHACRAEPALPKTRERVISREIVRCRAERGAHSPLVSTFDTQRPVGSEQVSGCHSGAVSAETSRLSTLRRRESADERGPALRAAVRRLRPLVKLQARDRASAYRTQKFEAARSCHHTVSISLPTSRWAYRRVGFTEHGVMKGNAAQAYLWPIGLTALAAFQTPL